MGMLRQRSPFVAAPTVTRKLSGWLLFECPCGYARTVPTRHDLLDDVDHHREYVHGQTL